MKQLEKRLSQSNQNADQIINPAIPTRKSIVPFPGEPYISRKEVMDIIHSVYGDTTATQPTATSQTPIAVIPSVPAISLIQLEEVEKQTANAEKDKSSMDPASKSCPSDDDEMSEQHIASPKGKRKAVTPQHLADK